jgi:hypothetical protein
MTQNWNDEAYYGDYYEEAPGRSWSTLALVLSGLAGVLLGFACAACLGGIALAILVLPADNSSNASAPTPVVVIAPTPQPVNPAPAPELPPLPSGGLGLSKPEWEQIYGPGAPTDRPDFFWYQGGTYLVGFQEGNISYIERQWPPENAVPVDEARRQSGALIPGDSQNLQSGSPEGRADLIVDLYSSPWLVSRFSGGVWAGGQPGNFTVTFNVYEPGVTRMAISLGNNPS